MGDKQSEQIFSYGAAIEGAASPGDSISFQIQPNEDGFEVSGSTYPSLVRVTKAA